MFMVLVWLLAAGPSTANAIRIPFPYGKSFPTKLKRFQDESFASANRLATPKVVCSEKTIGIDFEDGQFFGRRIFASKHEDEPACVKHVTGKTPRFELPFQFLPCGLKSKRTHFPVLGIEYSLKVIVSYDESRMTEDDEIYSLTCRYIAKQSAVGTLMEVSPYSKTYLIGDDNTPKCTYSLHLNTLDGPPIDNARLGDTIFHEWKCETHNYAIKVYECYVHNGADQRSLIIDENGCSRDRSIMPDLSYDASLNLAYASSRVFKFSGSSKMYFDCNLYICPKADKLCRESVPPACGNGGARSRGKRFSSLRNGVHELTLNNSQPLFRELQRREMARIHVDPDALVVPDQSPPKPVLILEAPEKDKGACACGEPGFRRSTVLLLVITNFLTLAIATIAIFLLNRKRFSAKFQVTATK